MLVEPNSVGDVVVFVGNSESMNAVVVVEISDINLNQCQRVNGMLKIKLFLWFYYNSSLQLIIYSTDSMNQCESPSFDILNFPDNTSRKKQMKSNLGCRCIGSRYWLVG